MYNDHTTGISVEGSRLASQLSRSICWGTGNVRREGVRSNLHMQTNYKKVTTNINLHAIGELKGDGKAFGSINSQILCSLNFDAK